MILIAILLLVCLYLFWHFDRQRRSRNLDHHRERREALNDLLDKVRDKETRQTDTIKTKEDDET
jgi:CHASE3 domain sensor protein